MVFTQQVSIGNPIGNLYRKNHTLILIQCSDGCYVLGKKLGFYPDHIARFVGGGVNPGEDPDAAAVREIEEELGLAIVKDRLDKLVVVETSADTSEGPMAMTTTVFGLSIDSSSGLVANDDLTGIAKMTLHQIEGLVEDMINLTGTYQTSKFSFEWNDWGKIYGPIHKVAIERHKSCGC